ncbi:MAG TPA: OsmC family peroxiredoxin [Longimicrobiales bacterium]|nr:OsmC family peroxiredoxin [Longimicrobiales bacterium]
MKRTASATWLGTLEKGQGEIRSESGVLQNSRYTYEGRFTDGRGARETTPEELLGAAHAGCYSMALSKILDNRGIRPERIDTDATVTLEPTDGTFSITEVHLATRVEAPGADRDTFEEAVREARTECVVSRALEANVTVDATLID